MTLTRRTGALAALALTLTLGACSTPADLATPTLEPQFGTSQNDYGADVAYASSGRVYVLSEREGYDSNATEYEDDYYDEVLLHRYDNNGVLTWTRKVASATCSTYEEYECGDYGVKAHTLAADSRGYSYALVTYGYIRGDCSVNNSHYVEKYDASGGYVREVYLGASGSDLGASFGGTPTDLAVDGSGNLYVVRQQGEFVDDCYEGATNVVAKYSATGVLQWQRTSPVGTLYGVTVSSNGFVYVGGSTGVAKYTTSGDFVRKIAPGDTRDVAAVGTNTVYARNLTTVRKLDANGQQLWSKTQTGLSGVITIADMTTDAGANVYIAGKYGPSTNRDGFVRKLAASNGATSFSKTVATPAYDDARGVATLNGSEVFITGATQGPLAPPYEGRQDSNDGYVRKLSSSGSTVWTR